MTYDINTREAFGNLVRLRIIQKWGKSIEGSRQELESEGLSFGTITNVIGGGFPGKKDRLERICKVLDINVNDLNLANLVNQKFHRAFGINSLPAFQEEMATDDASIICFQRTEYKIGNEGSQGVIIGQSDAMKKVFDLLYNINNNPNQEAIVLITGETGTGKELVAQAVHYNNPRAGKKYIPLNITTVGDTLLESQLFGYKKGAFTDAKEDREGFLETVGDGTLFLDEISSLSPQAQAKLLRVLEDRSFYRIGDTAVSTFNGRVVAATKENMEELVKQGKLRNDLYFRLDQVRIQLPSLQEREDDSLLLFEHFVHQYNQRYKTQYDLEPSAAGKDAMRNYPFPGNVRELKNMITKAIFSSQSGPIIKIEQIIAEKIP